MTGGLIYCDPLDLPHLRRLVTCGPMDPGFELRCKVAYAEVTGSCRMRSADVLASVGRLADALREIDISIRLVIEEGTSVLGDASGCAVTSAR